MSVDATWDAFRSTRIRIAHASLIVEVAPAPLGKRGAFLTGVSGPLHVLTAWNPHGVQATDSANALAARAFEAELSAMKGISYWPTTGFGADASWHEDGFTVAGMSLSSALALATRWEQRAIFRWTDEPGGFRLIACDGSADESRGWTTRIVS